MNYSDFLVPLIISLSPLAVMAAFTAVSVSLINHPEKQDRFMCKYYAPLCLFNIEPDGLGVHEDKRWKFIWDQEWRGQLSFPVVYAMMLMPFLYSAGITSIFYSMGY